MNVCLICGQTFNSRRELSVHIRYTEKMTIKEYYDLYILKNQIDKICEYCGNYKSWGQWGYNNTCGNIECIKRYRKDSCLKKYGVENVFQIKDIKNKSKKTLLKKYGVDNISKCEKVKHLKNKKSLEKYGTSCTLHADDISKKVKRTLVNKYGVDNYTKTDEYKYKTKQTCLKKYGTENPMFNGDVVDKLKNTCFKYTSKMIYELRPDVKLLGYTKTIIYNQKTIYNFQCNVCSTYFEDYISTRCELHPSCPNCNPVEYSSIENKVYNYVRDILSDDVIIRCDREVIKPYELDLYIPHLNLGIECDGDYWHSDEVMLEKYNMTNYEYCKLKNSLCENKDITLLRFTEYEINNEFEKVKEIIDKITTK